MSLLRCTRCGHPEDMHKPVEPAPASTASAAWPSHRPCAFHTCDCPRFVSSAYIER